MFFVILNETLFFFFVFLTENCKFSKKNYDCVDFADVGCFDNGIFVVQEKCVGVNFFFFFHLQDFFCAFINFFHVKNFFLVGNDVFFVFIKFYFTWEDSFELFFTNYKK